ncbi:sulfhydryl oxidase 2 [Ambystoma mexicanum]|uniref:sulfhydryl oxidase 2 n=1 Tax=Ambystoma mexicanum TaxID=8296 RepID=UPI0037E97D0F
MAPGRVRWALLLLLWAVLLPRASNAGQLYTSVDPLYILDGSSLQRAVFNSSTAWVLEFYSSWCGHCVNYAPTWRALANDVTEWEPAIKIGVLDCAEEKNYETCKEYGIKSYPTFRFFKAFTKEFTAGESYKAGTEQEIEVFRQIMIDFLQDAMPDQRPPACPPLEPIGSKEVLSLFEKKNPHFTAVVFENDNSYVGREVILDLIQYENILVRRALDADKALLEKLAIASAPSCYLIYPNGSHGLINILKPLRSMISSHLKSLPGVRKTGSPHPIVPVEPKLEDKTEARAWDEYDQSKLYMVDLESGLHYLLRVELATHKTLDGEKLKTFKDFITILAKLFPGRQPVVKLLETVHEWLVNLPLDKIPYDAILDMINNKMRIGGIFLPSHVKWVACQGSRPELRGYTCSLWKLFHSLTVQAATRPEALADTDVSPQAVLQIMRRYIHHFFGCRECAEHFEAMAKESMDSVMSLDGAVLWLWQKHNVVNNRLAGAPSEDPKFPKLQWPNQDLCPSCFVDKDPQTWNEADVLAFMKHFYSIENTSDQFTENERDESQEDHLSEAQKKDQSVPKKPNGQSKKEMQDSKDALRPEFLDKLIQNKHPDPKDQSKRGMEQVAVREEDKQSISFLGIGFSNIDMSLCVVLYLASSLFLMIMYFFFRMRSRRWKIRYSRAHV